MNSPQEILEQIVGMSQTLAQPGWDCVILGEGNTSARVDEESFYVKASGHQLASAGTEGYVRVRFAPILEFLASSECADEAVTEVLTAAVLEPARLRPSIETTLHAHLLSFEGVNFIGHTHPSALLILVGSQEGPALVRSGRITPEEVALLGPEPCWVPYSDPGVALGRAVRDAVAGYVDKWGCLPNQLLVENHGLIVPGRTAQEVVTRTQMAVKAARVLAGTMAFGGPRFLPPEEIQRVMTRPDEAVRMRAIGWSV